MCQTPPLLPDGDGAEGSDGCEDETAEPEVCTGVWDHNTKFLRRREGSFCEGQAGAEPGEMKRPSAVGKDTAVKGEAEAWRLLGVQSGWSPGTGRLGFYCGGGR